MGVSQMVCGGVGGTQQPLVVLTKNDHFGVWNGGTTVYGKPYIFSSKYTPPETISKFKKFASSPKDLVRKNQSHDASMELVYSLRITLDPPMEGWTNMFVAGVFWSSKISQVLKGSDT